MRTVRVRIRAIFRSTLPHFGNHLPWPLRTTPIGDFGDEDHNPGAAFLAKSPQIMVHK